MMILKEFMDKMILKFILIHLWEIGVIVMINYYVRLFQCKELKYDVITYIFDGLKTLDNSNFVDKVKCDVCVVWGDKDGCFVKKDQDELIKGLVNASKVKFEVIQGCPHNMCVNKEFCDKTVEIIDNFVNEWLGFLSLNIFNNF